jgi:toxin-antitoxin system PIN domain toxin
VVHLLDANVLIALATPEHDQHESARHWFANLSDSFTTCPITQGALMRYLVRRGSTAGDAKGLLEGICQHARHLFWPDSLTYLDVRTVGLVGHGQVTDAYLAQLARHHRARLATFDHGLVALHSDVAELIPDIP